MTANTAWALFRATGAPAYYLAYRALLAEEEQAQSA